MISFVPKKPHFFKPVLPSTKHGFLIPISFIEKYLKGIKLDKAELRRGNLKWEVKITNKRGLEQGWPKFMEDNNIQEGHFLVFRHEGGLVFEVLHFDYSTLLKPPPPTTSFSSNPPLPRVKRDNIISDNDHHSAQIPPRPNREKNRVDGSNVKAIRKQGVCSRKFGLEGEAMSLSRNITLGSGLPYVTGTLSAHNISCSILYFPMKFARANHLTKNCEMTMKDGNGRSFSMLLKHRGSHVYIVRGFHQLIAANDLKEGDSYIVHLLKNGNHPFMNFTRLTKFKKRKQESSKFKYEEKDTNGHHSHQHDGGDNPSFRSSLTPSNINYSTLYIPMEFARSNGLMNRDCEIIMNDEKGRSFPMWLKQTTNHVAVSKGFDEFIAANDLKEGDLYIVHLLQNGNRPLLNFLRLNKIPQKKQAQGEDPYLSSTLTQSNMHLSNLNIPMEFARLNGLINRDCKMTMTDEKGRSFPMSLKCRGTHVRICKGFNHFIASNGLKQGDPFILRLLHNGNKPRMNLVRLTKFKKRKQELSNLKHEEMAANRHDDHQHDGGGNPSFRSSLTPSNIINSALYIPLEFARLNGLTNRDCKMILRDEKGRSYPMLLIHKGSHVSICKGFKHFVASNGLKQGESFILHLLHNGNEPIMKFIRTHEHKLGKDQEE